MKVASTFSPLKYKTSEKISDSIAAVKSNLSVTLNFLNIFIYDYLTHFIGHVMCPVFCMVSGLQLDIQMYTFLTVKWTYNFALLFCKFSTKKSH